MVRFHYTKINYLQYIVALCPYVLPMVTYSGQVIAIIFTELFLKSPKLLYVALCTR